MTTQYKWLPEHPTQEMINEVNNVNFFASIYIPDDALADLYKVMWRSAPAVSQKPVAILGHDVPLYTRPQPKREPLSEREINKLEMESYQLLFEKWNGRAPELVDHFKAFARAIEKAHGIGVDE